LLTRSGGTEQYVMKRIDYQPTASLWFCLFDPGKGATMTNQLSEEEVKQILDVGPRAEIMKELYSFGFEMVKEASERYHRYDSKATKIAGYAGAIVALLVSEFSIWGGAVDAWAVPVVLGAALLALVSAALGLTAISLREIQTYSPHDWIRKEVLDDPQRLRNYSIRTMYRVRQSYIAQCHGKASRIRWAHWTLFVAGTFLLVALIDGSVRRMRGADPHAQTMRQAASSSERTLKH